MSGDALQLPGQENRVSFIDRRSIGRSPTMAQWPNTARELLRVPPLHHAQGGEDLPGRQPISADVADRKTMTSAADAVPHIEECYQPPTIFTRSTSFR